MSSIISSIKQEANELRHALIATRDRIAELETENAELRLKLDAAVALSVAVDDWAADDQSAEHLITTNDEFTLMVFSEQKSGGDK